MLNALQPYTKAVVAFALLLVAALANWLGVETGIDVTHQWQVIGLVLLTTFGVYQVPNKDSDDE